MLKIEKTDVYGWDAAIRGMRNPMNSWDKSDSFEEYTNYPWVTDPSIGVNDRTLMEKLVKAGTDHRKFMRMVVVYVDVTAPLYWWKEYDTYKVGTVANSCSTMHKIHAKEFTLDDFSTDRMFETDNGWIESVTGIKYLSPLTFFEGIVHQLNVYRGLFLETNDKRWWNQMIQLLPSSYNQRRTLMLNYEVLANIYRSRRNHKLDEWHTFCDWVESLPESHLITGKERCKDE